jgi:hypothetical protein
MLTVKLNFIIKRGADGQHALLEPGIGDDGPGEAAASAAAEV